MSTNICSYQDCMVRRWPCGSLAFFRFPSDSRRQVWIRNSGNPALLNLKNQQTRFLCENHFNIDDIRVQFNRKTLRKHAVPRPHRSVLEQRDLVEEAAESGREKVNESEKRDATKTSGKRTVGIEKNRTKSTRNRNVSLPEDQKTVGFTLEEDETSSLEEVMAPNGSDRESPTFEIREKRVREEREAQSPLPEPHCCCDNLPPGGAANDNGDYASDRHFALSLINYFQRLPKELKAKAKIKILSYLTALEFGSGGDL